MLYVDILMSVQMKEQLPLTSSSIYRLFFAGKYLLLSSAWAHGITSGIAVK